MKPYIIITVNFKQFKNMIKRFKIRHKTIDINKQHQSFKLPIPNCDIRIYTFNEKLNKEIKE